MASNLFVFIFKPTDKSKFEFLFSLNLSDGLGGAILRAKTATDAKFLIDMGAAFIHGDCAAGANKQTFAAIAAALRNLILFHAIISFQGKYITGRRKRK